LRKQREPCWECGNKKGKKAGAPNIYHLIRWLVLVNTVLGEKRVGLSETKFAFEKEGDNGLKALLRRHEKRVSVPFVGELPYKKTVK